MKIHSHLPAEPQPESRSAVLNVVDSPRV